MVETLDIALDCEIEDVFTWSEENVKTQLPLQPSGQLTLTLYIKAKGKFCVKSSNTKPANVPPTPTVNRTDRIPGISNPPRSPSTSLIEQQTIAPHEIDISKLQQSIEGILNIQYSGGDGVNEYFRRTALVLNVDIQPSIVFTKWTTIPATDPRQFHLVLDAMNAASQDFIVQYGDEQCKVALESQKTKRMAVRVDRFELSDEEIRDSVDYEGQEVCLHPILYSQQLATMVDIRWHCPVNGKSGVASVEQLKLSQEELDNVIPCPIWWEVRLNEVPHTIGEPVVIAQGEVLTVAVCVTSKSESSVGPVELSSEVYIDHENERREIHPIDKVACLGNTSCTVEQFGSDQSVTHECSFLFLYEGIYKIGIAFKELGHQSTHPSSSRRLVIALEREDRIWKYRPPVEVHVQ